MKELIIQYEFVRLSGKTNMMDRPIVRLLAIEYGFDKLVEATADTSSYMKLLNSYDVPTTKDYQKWLEIFRPGHSKKENEK